jgi:type I restriction enzyme M protein
MYGAILGDIIGSRFEFDRGPWTKEFELLTEECRWTDDTVMTVAIAEALLNAGENATVSEIEALCRAAMQKWGRKYPHAGYGGNFGVWLRSDDPKPYGSYGNGSAMRVSSAGWLYDSLERTREVARATATPTHDHPEGIKGAECTAAVIFLARTRKTKNEIRTYVESNFGYDLSSTVAEYSKNHRHDETCQDSLPKALVSFLEGEDFEDVIRNAISMGGDADTIAAIAGSMAEAFYGVPTELKGEVLSRIRPDMLEVVERFEQVTNGKRQS